MLIRSGRLIAVALAFVACHPFSASDLGGGLLSVRVNVTGDVDLSPPSYGVMIDDLKWRDVRPNETNSVEVRPGSHVIELIGPGAETKSVNDGSGRLTVVWCSSLTEKRQLVEANGQPFGVTYDVNCPPLTGSGTLQIDVSVHHSSPIPDLKMTYSRVNGTAYSEQRTINSSGRITVNVPPGLYTFTLSGPNCLRTFEDIVFGYQPAVVRADGIGKTILYLTCP